VEREKSGVFLLQKCPENVVVAERHFLGSGVKGFLGPGVLLYGVEVLAYFAVELERDLLETFHGRLGPGCDVAVVVKDEVVDCVKVHREHPLRREVVFELGVQEHFVYAVRILLALHVLHRAALEGVCVVVLVRLVVRHEAHEELAGDLDLGNERACGDVVLFRPMS